MNNKNQKNNASKDNNLMNKSGSSYQYNQLAQLHKNYNSKIR